MIIIIYFKLKYSSKQREEWSDIDYFGARYYSNEQFRFTSPDPIKINKERTYKPWLLNLYAYTRNNPMSYVDMDGRETHFERETFGTGYGGGWDKVNPKEFRRVMTIPLLAAGAIAGAGISWSLGWAYTPEIIAAGKYLLTSSVNTAYRAKVFYDIELNERLGEPFVKILELTNYGKSKNIDPEKVGFFIRKYIEGMIEGFIPGPPNLNTCGEYLGYTTYKTAEKTLETQR